VNEFSVIGSCSDLAIAFSDSISAFGALPTNDPFDNELDPMTFSVPQDYAGSFVYFTLTFVARGGAYRQELRQRVLVGSPEILLVDDDDGARRDTFYTQALDSLGQAYAIWNVFLQGSPAAVLTQYPKVIWFTGDYRSDTLTLYNVAALISYLSGGGRLMMTSQDIVERLSQRGSPQDSLLLHRYLKAGYNTTEMDHHPTGVAGTVFDSLVFLTSGSGGAGNQVSQDALTPDPGGIELIRYRSNRAAAIGVVSNYVSLIAGFGMEGINDLYPGLYGSRREFMAGSIEFLSQPFSISDIPGPLPEGSFLAQNYPNPFNPTTEIAFGLLSAGNVRLVIYDLLGREISRPVDGCMQAGRHIVTWNGASRPSGVYFYKLMMDGGSVTRRMTLLK
jgi:hypothetical protein